MKSKLLSIINALESKFEHKEDTNDSSYDEKNLINDIKAAREEWLIALNYFEQVSDSELIDYSIYRIEAARRKYMYLLKQARQYGIEDNGYIDQMTGIC